MGESSQADRGDSKPSHTSRRRQSKSQCNSHPRHFIRKFESVPGINFFFYELDAALAPTTVNEVHAKETVENKRFVYTCLVVCVR